MFDELVNRIPQREPDLQIGSFQLWVSGYNNINQKDQGDFAYLRTPSLLTTNNIIAFSEKSDTELSDFKKFLKDLLFIYENITIKHTLEFTPDNSQFGLRLANNDLGQIHIIIKYNSWMPNGSLEFEEVIDQSYLPKIISDLKIILAKKY